MAYVDLNTINNPTAGQPLPAAWGDQVRENLEFLIDPPVCSVYNSTSQTVGNNTTTALTADSENFDNASMHSTSSQTSRITITTAGRYLFYGTVAFAADADGYRRVSLRVDGTTAYGGMSGIVDGSNVGVRIQATRSLVLTVGQYVEVTCLHTAGNDLAVTLDEFYAQFLSR